MRINREMFREYDIRGVADQDLTTEAAFGIARAFGKYARERGYLECSWALTIGRVHRS